MRAEAANIIFIPVDREKCRNKFPTVRCWFSSNLLGGLNANIREKLHETLLHSLLERSHNKT